LLVCLSGLARGWNRERAAAAGFHGYLLKPCQPGEMCRILDHLVSGQEVSSWQQLRPLRRA
jgi:hypothetical protein